MDDDYRWIFENSVPGLPEEAEKHGLSPLEYMRKLGCFEVSSGDYTPYAREIATERTTIDPLGQVLDRESRPVGVQPLDSVVRSPRERTANSASGAMAGYVHAPGANHPRRASIPTRSIQPPDRG